MTRDVPLRRLAALSLTMATVLGAAACGGSKHHQSASPPAGATRTPSPTPAKAAVTCPLTGLAPAAGQDPHRAALAVKIDNIDPARPQAGLNRTDLVVEELVEGGLTRLFAVFQCSSAPVVGPIRSARTSDADLLAMLHGSVFAYSGANPRAIPPIRRHGNAVLLSNDEMPRYFHRDSSRPAPHNVFSSTERLLAAGVARRHGLTAPPPVFTYSAGAPGGASAAPSESPSASASPSPAVGSRATRVELRWPAASAGWRWNGKAWLRTQNGSADVLADRSRVSAANVVVLQIRIGSTGIRDVAGNASPLDETTGSGRAWILRGGTLVVGTWRRTSGTAPLVLRDGSGAPVPLQPGRTWVELLPRPGRPRIG